MSYVFKVKNYDEFYLKCNDSKYKIKVDDERIEYFKIDELEPIFSILKKDISNFFSEELSCDNRCELLHFTNIYIFLDIFDILYKSLKKLCDKYDKDNVIKRFNNKIIVPHVYNHRFYLLNIDNLGFDLLTLKTYIIRLYLEKCGNYDNVTFIKNKYVKYAGFLAYILISRRDMNHCLSPLDQYIAIKCIIGYRDFEINLYCGEDNYQESNKLFDKDKFSEELKNYRSLKTLI